MSDPPSESLVREYRGYRYVIEDLFADDKAALAEDGWRVASTDWSRQESGCLWGWLDSLADGNQIRGLWKAGRDEHVLRVTYERERDEYYENWMRSQADFKNLRRRQQQVIDAATAATRRELLSGLLLVLDFLDMALRTPVETAEGRNLLQGVKMTRDHLMQFLSQWEVEAIDEGGIFDPTLHEAVETVADSGEAPGTIVETVRKGYRQGSDVLRHAHVKVAAEAAETQDGAEAE